MKIEDLQNLRVAIIGGGYGGVAAAVALDRIGVRNVAVYEQAPAFGQVGAGIGLRPETVERFRRWGIFDAIAAVSSPSDHLEILSADGNTVFAQEEWPNRHAFAQVNDTRIIHRGDFIDAFSKALPAGALHLDHRLTEIVDNGSTATLTFANGNVVEADVVIGADGIRSLVRSTFFSDKAPVFANEHAYRIVIDIEDAHGLVTDDNPRFYMGTNGVIAYNLPLRHRGQLSYDITAPSDDDTWAPEITNDYLVSLLDGFDERIVAIARELDVAQVTSRSVYDIDSVDNWHTDCIALLGDAAHAMLHHQGQGANSAIADGDALADAFREAGSVKEALALYVATRKPVTDELQRISRAGWNAEAVEDAFPGQR
ncbi:FAD-dependent monooxygenase [Microbacterium sp. NPDC096154]|uniref:FAD-dependent oxidoreductase n=1 Tax=Microbacterium sp. NPDC096154 TaxID=3155549 RepID=UPI0033306911